MDDYFLRLALQEDMPAMAFVELVSAKRFIGTGLIDDLLETTFDREKLASSIEQQQVWLACIESTGEIVGFAIASVRGQTAYLEELDVLPAHGRKGLGARLVRAVCDWAWGAGFCELCLCTFKDIQWNAPYYERLGFRALPEELLSPILNDVRAEEKAHGLPVDKRIFMSFQLPWKS